MWIGIVPAHLAQTWFLRSGNAGGTSPTSSQYVSGSHGLSNVSSGCGPGSVVPAVIVAASAVYTSFVSRTEKYFIFGLPSRTYCTRTPGFDVSSVLRSHLRAHAK